MGLSYFCACRVVNAWNSVPDTVFSAHWLVSFSRLNMLVYPCICGVANSCQLSCLVCLSVCLSVCVCLSVYS